MTQNNARLSILNEVLSLPTIRGKDWTSTPFNRNILMVGDLVAMSNAPASKWYLSWLREIQPNNGWPKYLLESIDDGSLCWWGNIGLDFYNRERVKENPQWRWNDRQFLFARRWYRVCKKIDGWEIRACQPKFNTDGSVELNVRTHRLFDDKFTNPRSFSNWNKVTVSQIELYYRESIAMYKKQRERKGIC